MSLSMFQYYERNSCNPLDQSKFEGLSLLLPIIAPNTCLRHLRQLLNKYIFVDTKYLAFIIYVRNVWQHSAVGISVNSNGLKSFSFPVC